MSENIHMNFHRSRIGFHYYPDTTHYREGDLQIWLPRLFALNASWVVLQAPHDRAIPEHFLAPLVKNGIEPILQFSFSFSNPPDPASLAPILAAYQRWGVHTIVFFDRPNSRSAWPLAGWAQGDLVNRFLDIYLPYAKLALANNLIPVLPPLEPGGSYWDTAFLRSTLEELQKRGQVDLLKKLVLSAYGWTHGQALNWGAGGPDRWPGAHPYFTPPGEQDNLGFRAFDWYQAVARAVLGRACPLLVFGAGIEDDPNINQQISPSHTDTNLAIARLLNGELTPDPRDKSVTLDAIPSEVISVCFWLLSAEGGSSYSRFAWYVDAVENLPVVKDFINLAVNQRSGFHPGSQVEKPLPNPETDKEQMQTEHFDEFPPTASQIKNSSTGKSVEKTFGETAVGNKPKFSIEHYLLLPTFEWGIADWHLDVIRPFIKKYRPTIGFSAQEAFHARRITIIGDPQMFPESLLEQMRSTGALVDRITGDGMMVATQLDKR